MSHHRTGNSDHSVGSGAIRAVGPATDYFATRVYSTLETPTPFRTILKASPLGDTASQADPTQFDLCYETSAAWHPVVTQFCHEAPLLNRLVDGSAQLSLLAWVRHGPGLAAVVGGTTGAMAGQIVSRRLHTEPPVLPGQHCRVVVGVCHHDADDAALEELIDDLRAAGVPLFTRSLGAPADGEHLSALHQVQSGARSAALQQMRQQEVAAVQGADAPLRTVTIVDGPLRAHIRDESRRSWPLIGVVKRHKRRSLPMEVVNCILRLDVGERTPAMIIDPESFPRVTWYLKLAPDFGLPLKGVVRVEATSEFVRASASEAGPAEWINAISAQIVDMRTLRGDYARRDCSLEPIVVLEDRLKALAGHSVESHMRRLLGLR